MSKFNIRITVFTTAIFLFFTNPLLAKEKKTFKVTADSFQFIDDKGETQALKQGNYKNINGHLTEPLYSEEKPIFYLRGWENAKLLNMNIIIPKDVWDNLDDNKNIEVKLTSEQINQPFDLVIEKKVESKMKSSKTSYCRVCTKRSRDFFGNEICIEREDKKYEFEVTVTKDKEWLDVKMFEPNTENQISVFSFYSKYTNHHRFPWPPANCVE